MEGSDEEFLLADDDDLLAAVFAVVCAEPTEQATAPSLRQGSNKRRIKRLARDIASGHAALVRDYLGDSPVYSEKLFERRHCVPIAVFNRICGELSSQEHFFQQHSDAVGLMGASTEQKVAAALHMLSEGDSADAQDQYYRISESLASSCMKKFCKSVVEIFGREFLRSPSREDTEKILAFNANRGLPGLFGSLDCFHWDWSACLNAWKGYYQGKGKKPTVILGKYWVLRRNLVRASQSFVLLSTPLPTSPHGACDLSVE